MTKLPFLFMAIPAIATSVDTGSGPAFATYEFGFSLSPTGVEGQLYTLFIYKVLDGQVLESTAISEKTFVMQATGMEASRANPEGVDLFELYRVPNCAAHRSSTDRSIDHRCDPLAELWKLRYGGASSGTSTAGWAQQLNEPGLRQQIILQAYRPPEYDHWLGPYFGEQAFLRLRDITDPGWIGTYRDGR